MSRSRTPACAPSPAPRAARPAAPAGWLRLALAALLPALLAACSAAAPGSSAAAPGPAASGSSGDRLLVRLYKVHVASAAQRHIGPPVARSPVRLELSNQSNPELADVYSKEQNDAELKLAPDELMSELIADLDTLGFQKLSAPGKPPATGARGWIEVQKNGASRTFVVPETAFTAEQLTTFVNMKLAVNEYYRNVSGLQYIDNPKGAALLKGSEYRGGK